MKTITVKCKNCFEKNYVNANELRYRFDTLKPCQNCGNILVLPSKMRVVSEKRERERVEERTQFKEVK